MITGGFGRQLTPGQVTKYRDEWLARVVKRKADADKLASIKMVTGHTINEDKEPSLENRDGTDAEGTTPSHDDDFEYEKEKKTELLKNYLMNILLINQAHQSICQAKMDGGTTADMLNGSYALSDFYEKVLIELSQFYTAGHFDKPTPERYFRELVSSRYVWHGLSIEPFGKSGCMVERAMAISAAMSDMEDMIFSMVGSLVGLLGYNIKEGFDFETWRKEWKKKRASRG